jgi:hypothetical protein
VPARHPLRVIKGIVDDALIALDAEFAQLYEGTGRLRSRRAVVQACFCRLLSAPNGSDDRPT